MNTSPKSASARSSIVPVDFSKPPPRPRLKQLRVRDSKTQELRTVPGIYVIEGREGYYARPYCNGKQREKKLEASTLKYAQMEYGKLLHAIEAFQNGVGPDPFKQTEEKTVSDLCDFYLKLGCPRRKGPPKPGKALEEEKRHVEKLKQWPGSKRPAKEITLEDCRRYRDWRVKLMLKGKGGDRQVDIELVTLSNVFRCAMRNSTRTGITANPIGIERERFRNPSQVDHCREYMPKNADELHAIARYFFQNPRSEVFGWMVLLQPMIGHRIHELLKLRTDAKNKSVPGFTEGNKMFLFRSLSSKGTYGHIDLFKELRLVLEAHKVWHLRRYPGGSPWFFPCWINPKEPLAKSSFGHALKRAAEVLGLPKRTTHGLRAYRVNVMRSQGLLDSEIALRIGQKTGGPLIVQVYGEGLDYKLTYIPEEIAPAWDQWLPKEKRTGPTSEQQQLI